MLLHYVVLWGCFVKRSLPVAAAAKVWGGSGAAAAPVAATAKIKPGEQTFGYAELKGGWGQGCCQG